MSTPIRSSLWPAAVAVLALALAYDLGARAVPSSVGLGAGGDQVSVQVDVTEAGQVVFTVPVDRTFILKDLLCSNTAGNSRKDLNIGKQTVYPSLRDQMGVIKIAGTNLMDWAKGNGNSSFGGGRSGFKGSPLRSQVGLVGLTGGVVFEPGSLIMVDNYLGPLYFDGVLVP